MHTTAELQMENNVSSTGNTLYKYSRDELLKLKETQEKTPIADETEAILSDKRLHRIQLEFDASRNSFVIANQIKMEGIQFDQTLLIFDVIINYDIETKLIVKWWRPQRGGLRVVSITADQDGRLIANEEDMAFNIDPTTSHLSIEKTKKLAVTLRNLRAEKLLPELRDDKKHVIFEFELNIGGKQETFWLRFYYNGLLNPIFTKKTPSDHEHY
ncbi:unnamed protein product, partial [Mesorhabditis belari]|uniref:Uncharacterized protein n=1 Tax=Mesorhabditis belari TaxID=2138241 RepID=A0AAF3FG62_9BILA